VLERPGTVAGAHPAAIPRARSPGDVHRVLRGPRDRSAATRIFFPFDRRFANAR